MNFVIVDFLMEKLVNVFVVRGILMDKSWEELRKLYSADFDRMRKELEHFQQTKIPRCMICKTNLVNAEDRVTGKVSKNLWKPNCSCYSSRNLVLSVG